MIFRYPFFIFLIIPISLIIFFYLKPAGYRNILRIISKLIVILIILMSIASPYTIIEQEKTSGSNEVMIITDRTESMRLFRSDTPDEIFDFLKKRTSVSIGSISGTKTSLGDSIFRNVKQGSNILVISDGNNNYGRSILEAINFARNLNSTIYYIWQEPIKNDMSISISGDPEAVLDVPFDFFIDINTIGTIEGEVRIYVDDMLSDTFHVDQKKRIPIKYSFNAPGSHRLMAEISGVNDEISENNVFYRSVYVFPKPEILLISKKESPLSKILNQQYSVDISPNFKDFSSYKAVIVDNIAPSDLSENEASLLSDHVVNGGGLVVIGGAEGYTDARGKPLFEQLLPVIPGGAQVRSKKAAVVLVIDISGSTGDFSGDTAKLRIEKGLAKQVIESLSADDLIGVIAFNNAPHTIVPLARYSDNTVISDTISRLSYGGTTHLSPALSAAFDMVRNFEGGKNIIVISDGVVADAEASLKITGLMAEEGVNLYAIGVGWDTDESFMNWLAGKGNGIYLKRDQAHGLQVLFGEITGKEKMDGYPLLMINSNHFITNGISLNATILGYNEVFAKQNAQTLVMTSTGNPVISAWRFGLGRVVSITTDDGNTWAQELYNEGNSKIISTSVNYAIGNPRKNENIRVNDGEIGEPLDILITSEYEPGFTYDHEPVQLDHVGERTYKATIVPEAPGFHEIPGYVVAINQPFEYREVGNNGLMPGIIRAAGGQVYNTSEIERFIPDIAKKNTAITLERVDLAPVFLFAALMFYGIEVILRRYIEIIR